MARFIRSNKDGSLIRIEFSAKELAEKVLEVPLEDLLAWSRAIPPHRGSGEESVYAASSQDEVALMKKRARVLSRRTTEEALAKIEQAGLLDAYAALAVDCPEGLPVHVWRSYGLVVLMQARYGSMIGPKELAERANLRREDEKGNMVADVEMAKKHLRLLDWLGYLRRGEGRWEHKGLPESWRGAE